MKTSTNSRYYSISCCNSSIGSKITWWSETKRELLTNDLIKRWIEESPEEIKLKDYSKARRSVIISRKFFDRSLRTSMFTSFVLRWIYAIFYYKEAESEMIEDIDKYNERSNMLKESWDELRELFIKNK